MKVLNMRNETEPYGFSIILRTPSIAERVKIGELGARLLGTLLADKSK